MDRPIKSDTVNNRISGTMNSTGNSNPQQQDTDTSNRRPRVLISKTEPAARNNNGSSRIDLMAMLPHNLFKSGNNDNSCRVDVNARLPNNLCKPANNDNRCRIDLNAMLPHNLYKSGNNDNRCRIDLNAILPHNLYKPRSTSSLGQQNPTSTGAAPRIQGPSRDAPLTRNVAPEQINRRSDCETSSPLWNCSSRSRAGSSSSRQPHTIPWQPHPFIRERDHGRLSEVSLRTPISPVNQRMDMPGGGFDGRDVLSASEGRDELDLIRLDDPFANGFFELHDRHRDMRLDVDNMSYEELLALEERIGDVSTGLSEDKINKQRKYEATSSILKQCCICQDGYVAGDDILMLDCGHEFHTGCIGQWLRLKNVCPICKMTAIGT